MMPIKVIDGNGVEGLLVGFIKGDSFHDFGVIIHRHPRDGKQRIRTISLDRLEVLELPPTDTELADYVRARRALEAS